MFNKKLIAMFLSLLLFLCMRTYCFALEGYDSLDFHQTGCNYIYSNNPEPIKDENLYDSKLKKYVDGKYTISQKILANQDYIAEYSHVNKSSGKLTLAIMICNTGTKDAFVNVKRSRSVTFEVNVNSPEQSSIPAKLEADFSNLGFSTTTIKIPPVSTKNNRNGYVIINQTELPAGNKKFDEYKDYRDWSYHEGVGKVMFSTKNPYLYCKIIYIKSDKISNALLIDTPTDPENPNNRTTDCFKYYMRTASYDTNKPNHRFLLGSGKYDLYINKMVYTNTNEYEIKTPTKLNKSVFLGNYGIYYEITLENSSNKLLEVIADTYISQSYAISVGNLWKSYTADKINKKRILIQLPSKSINKVGFILPANNVCNVTFDFTNPNQSLSSLKNQTKTGAPIETISDIRKLEITSGISFRKMSTEEVEKKCAEYESYNLGQKFNQKYGVIMHYIKQQLPEYIVKNTYSISSFLSEKNTVVSDEYILKDIKNADNHIDPSKKEEGHMLDDGKDFFFLSNGECYFCVVYFYDSTGKVIGFCRSDRM